MNLQAMISLAQEADRRRRSPWQVVGDLAQERHLACVRTERISDLGNAFLTDPSCLPANQVRTLSSGGRRDGGSRSGKGARAMRGVGQAGLLERSLMLYSGDLLVNASCRLCARRDRGGWIAGGLGERGG